MCHADKSKIQVKLHIFNPEHEMALALNKNSFMLPHKIQEFRMNMGFLPALWASDGDCVLVDDAAYAVKALSRAAVPHADVLFVEDAALRDMPFSGVEPWGWNKALCHRLLNARVCPDLLPSDHELERIRELANRRLTTEVLQHVRKTVGDTVCGESFSITDIAELNRLLTRYSRLVVKMPWSSSGRGLCYLDNMDDMNKVSWIEKSIARHGMVMAEPRYQRVEDFAMEFISDGEGHVDYCGLSVFCTENGNYAGNIIATEEEKQSRLTRYVPSQLIESVKVSLQNFFSAKFRNLYKGPFGVDMMIVTSDSGCGFKLHPCVEVNVRMTMGHVANSVSTSPSEPVRLMRIVHDVNYTLRTVTPEPGFVKVY